MGVLRKTRTRIETLIAWLLAGAFVLLLIAGVYWVATVV